MQLKYPGKILLPLQPGTLDEVQVYRCARCDKSFTDKMELRQHISDKHIALPPLNEAFKRERKALEKQNKKSYVIVQKDQLQSVLRNELLKTGQVNNEKLYYTLNIPELKCCHCEATFKSQKTLELHSKTFHNNSTDSQTKWNQPTAPLNIIKPGDNSPPKNVNIQRRNSVAGGCCTTTAANTNVNQQRRSSTSAAPFLVNSTTIPSLIPVSPSLAPVSNPSLVPVANPTLVPVSNPTLVPVSNEPLNVPADSAAPTTSDTTPTPTASTIVFTPGPTDLQCYRCGVQFNNGPELHYCSVFKCDKCFEAFVSKDLLNTHYLLKHDIYLVPKHVKNISEFANIKNLNCKFCTAMFTKNKDLNKHYREFHKYSPNQMKTSVIKNYKDVTKFIHCTMCNDIFNSNFDLQKHYLDYHNYDSSVKKFEMTSDNSTQIGNLLSTSNLGVSTTTKKARKRKNVTETQTQASINTLNTINSVLNDALGYTVSSTVLNNGTQPSTSNVYTSTVPTDISDKELMTQPVIIKPAIAPMNAAVVEPASNSVIVNPAGANIITMSETMAVPPIHSQLSQVLPQQPNNCFTCDNCPAMFMSESALVEHVIKDHPALVTPPTPVIQQPLKCDFCSSEFETREKLKEHVKEIHKDLLTCIQCFRKFSNKYNLKRHVAVTHDAKYECTACNEIFLKRADLTKHRSQMHGQHVPKELSISTPCTAGFMNVTDFQCHICGRYLSSKYHLRRHMDNKHSSKIDKLLQCKTCVKGVLGISKFTSHLSIYHKSKTHEVETFCESAVVCNECSKIFLNKKMMKVHMKKKHKFKPHQCHICSRTYAFKKHITRHMEIHDSLKDFLSFSAPQDDENEWGDFGDYEGVVDASGTQYIDASNIPNTMETEYNMQEVTTPDAYNTQEINIQHLQEYQSYTQVEQPIHDMNSQTIYIENMDDNVSQMSQMMPTTYETQVIKGMNPQSMSVITSGSEHLVNTQADGSLYRTSDQLHEEALYSNQLQDNALYTNQADDSQLHHMQDSSMEYTTRTIEDTNQSFSPIMEHSEHHTLSNLEPTPLTPIENSNEFHMLKTETDMNMGDFHQLQNSQPHLEMMQNLDDTQTYQLSEEPEVCKTLILQNAEPTVTQHHAMLPHMILNNASMGVHQMGYVPQVIDNSNQGHLTLETPSRDTVVLQTPITQMYDPSYQNNLATSVDMANQQTSSGPIFVLVLKQPDQNS
uniref:Zinc finger and BTB domain-containing protein 41 n=2 Tax=Cacopsylla melanoneura TaxID=428564 RepID=A0A8D8YAQ8_9HEMI